MARYGLFLGISLAIQLLALSLYSPTALRAQQAVPPAGTGPTPDPSRHDAAIVRLRDVAYGKDKDGKYKEASARP